MQLYRYLNENNLMLCAEQFSFRPNCSTRTLYLTDKWIMILNHGHLS